MRFLKYLKNKYVVIGLLIITAFPLVRMVQAVTGEPGTDSDPIVSQSYVDEKVGEVSGLANSLKQQIQGLQVKSGAAFEVVEMKAGQQLVAGLSTELILRGGAAKAVDSPQGGLVDTTGGADIRMGSEIPLQHLIIVPRDDGRGLIVTSDKAWVMVKGTYTIK